MKCSTRNAERWTIRLRAGVRPSYRKELTLLLCLAATALTSMATPLSISFAYTGGLQTFVAPTAGLYDIIAFGAQGGTGFGFIPGFPGAGGGGAEIGGEFTLAAGETLQIAVGGQGGFNSQFSSGGGGGGGSFVVAPANVPLVIAGGGGGGGIGMLTGGVGQTNRAGENGLGPGSGKGGANGNGGQGIPILGAAGGGGFYTPGGGGGMLLLGGGRSFLLGLAGGGDPLGFGAHGGFGGGGAGFADGTLNDGSGGGGGGYSGGGAGFSPGDGTLTGSGGGGGSFDGGTNQVLIAGINAGDGSVVITELTPVVNAPEPSSWALFAVSLAGLLGVAMRHPLGVRLPLALWLQRRKNRHRHKCNLTSLRFAGSLLDLLQRCKMA